MRFRYAPARYDGTEREPRWAEVRPYLLEPSLATHALYLIGFDETRDALRTFKVERILDLSLTPRTFEPPEAGALEADAAPGVGHHRGPARDRGRAALRPVASAPASARRRGIRARRSREAADGSLEWRARVAGTIEIRLWILSWGDEVEVLAPAGAPRRRRRDARPGDCKVRVTPGRSGYRVRPPASHHRASSGRLG